MSQPRDSRWESAERLHAEFVAAGADDLEEFVAGHSELEVELRAVAADYERAIRLIEGTEREGEHRPELSLEEVLKELAEPRRAES